MGVVYGPSLRAVTALEQGNGQILAQLRLPAAAEPTFASYVLHPSVMDGALQACIGLLDGWSAGAGQPRVPFALEAVRILSPCVREMAAWVRYAPGSEAGSKVVKLDIDVCDGDGNICVQMRGLSTRAASAESRAGQAASIGAVLAAPVWETRGAEVRVEAGRAEYAAHHVILCELPVEAQALEPLLAPSRCLSLATSGTLAERYSEYALACFERVQAILQDKPQGRVLVQWVAAGEGESAVFSGLPVC
jgi:polyketide synthase PksN